MNKTETTSRLSTHLKTKNASRSNSDILVRKSRISRSPMANLETARKNTLNAIKNLVLPAYYICAIALHSLLKEIKKPIIDGTWNKHGQVQDKTQSLNVFRCFLSLLLNFALIWYYNNLLKSYLAPHNAFYVFNLTVIAWFIFYVWPQVNATKFTDGSPMIRQIVGDQNFDKMQPAWLKGALANLGVVGLFSSFCEIIPQFFMSDFWSYFSEIQQYLEIKPQDKVKENISLMSAYGQFAFTAPAIVFALFGFPIMTAISRISYFILFAALIGNIAFRMYTHSLIKKLHPDFGEKHIALKSNENILDAFKSVFTVPGCAALLISNLSYFLSSTFCDSIISSFVDETARNVFSAVSSGQKVGFPFHNYTHEAISKHLVGKGTQSFIDQAVNKEIKGKVKIFLGSVTTALTAVMSTLIARAVKNMGDITKLNDRAQKSVFVATMSACTIGTMALFKIISINAFWVAIMSLVMCVNRSAKYMVLDNLRYRAIDRISPDNKRRVRELVDLHATRFGKGPISFSVDLMCYFPTSLIFGSEQAKVYYSYSAVGSLFMLAFTFSSYFWSTRVENVVGLSVKEDTTFENAYTKMYAKKTSNTESQQTDTIETSNVV